MAPGSTIEDYELKIEAGSWRVADRIYPTCEKCPQRLCRVPTPAFVKKYFKPDYTLPNSAKMPAIYKELYRSLKWEFYPIDAVNADIRSIYSTSVEKEISEEQFAKDAGLSTIGALSAETLARFNGSDFRAKTTGSMFVLIRTDKGVPVAVLVADLSKNWIGFKSFWYKDPTGKDNKTIMTKICWFKFYELANRLGYPHVQLGYYDPANPRLGYKLNYSELPLEINARGDGNWLPIESLGEVYNDDRGNRQIRDIGQYYKNIGFDPGN
jgi:hypothetical protein